MRDKPRLPRTEKFVGVFYLHADVALFDLQVYRFGSNLINDKIVAIGYGRPQVAPTDGNKNYNVGQPKADG